MKVLSVFDGMSCGQIALDKLGVDVEVYYASEIDKPAMKVTNHNYPDTIQIGNVEDIKSKDLPQIDLLIGGSPCQGFSFAGKQLKLDDPRSKLFFEFERLLHECKPKYFLLENVVMDTQSQMVVTNRLEVPYIFINSSLVSAQSRQRLYWTNIDLGFFPLPPNKHQYIESILEEDVDEKYFLSPSVASRYVGVQRPSLNKEKSNVIGNIVTVREESYIRDGKVFKNDRQYRYQGDRVFDVKSKASSLSANGGNNGGGSCNIIFDNGRLRTLTPVECERLQTVPDNYTSIESQNNRYSMLGNGWTVDVIAHIFSKMEF